MVHVDCIWRISPNDHRYANVDRTIIIIYHDETS